MRYSLLPWAPKLANNIGQANLTGQFVWNRVNCRALADGSQAKRYGQERWSKYQLCKTPTDKHHLHDFTSADAWVGLTEDPNSQGPAFLALVGDSTLKAFARDGDATISHLTQSTTNIASENAVSIRFLCRFEDLPPIKAAGTFLTIKLGISTLPVRTIDLTFAENGFYGFGTTVETGSGQYIDGEWHVWEVNYTVGDSTFSLSRDDVVVDASLPLDTTNATTNGKLEILVDGDVGDNIIEAYFDYIYVSSKTTAGEALWTVHLVRGLFEYTNSVQQDNNLAKRFLIAHSGHVVWVDRNLDGRFVQLFDLLGSTDGIPNYCVFRDRLYFCDSADLRLISWDSIDVAEVVETAPPCSLLRPHAARLWLSGDPENPLRVHFSGIRDATDWTTSEGGSFLTSGFIPLEEQEGGDKTTALAGPWNGLLACFTEKTVQVIDGNAGNPNLFSRKTIVNGLGAASANSTAFIGNDLYFMSPRGVNRLSTTEQFGDIKQAYLSLPIDEYWAISELGEHKVVHVRNPFVYSTGFRANSWALWSFTMDASDINNFVLLYDLRTDDWYLWDLDAASLAEFKVPDENSLFLVSGDYDSYVNIFNPHLLQDFGSDITQTIETGRLDLRDLDGAYRDRMKRFVSIHVHLRQLRLDDSFTLSVQADERDPITYTISQNVFTQSSLGPNGSFRLGPSGQGALNNSETIGVVSRMLDTHAKYLKLKFEQSAGELALLGYELEVEEEGLQRQYV